MLFHRTTKLVFPLFLIFYQLSLYLSQLYPDRRRGLHHLKVCLHKRTAAAQGLISLMADRSKSGKIVTMILFEGNVQFRRQVSELNHMTHE